MCEPRICWVVAAGCPILSFFAKGWVAAIPSLELVSAVLVWIGHSCPMLFDLVFALWLGLLTLHHSQGKCKILVKPPKPLFSSQAAECMGTINLKTWHNFPSSLLFLK